MNKAICYIRIGPLETRKALFRKSSQKRCLQQYCQDEAIDVLLTLIDDKVVASVPLSDRLGGKDLLNIVKSEGIQHIITWRLDRLFRNASDCYNYVTSWKEAGIIFHVIDLNANTVRTDLESGLHFTNTISVLAAMEHNLPAERTKASIKLKKKHHIVYGITPFGYDLSGNQLVPNETEQEIIGQVQFWRGEGWSLRKIAGKLNEMAVPTKRSYKGTKSTKWYASTVRYLLQNPLYEGLNQDSRP